MRKPAGPALAFLVAALLIARESRGQAPSFVAEVDRTQVAAGDTFTYEVTLNAANEAVDGFRAPNFGALRVVSAPRGPNRSTQMQIGGGGTFIQNGYTWQFLLTANPGHKGAVTIGAARVQVDGREMKSNPVNVRVVDAGVAPPAQPRSRSPFAGLPGFGAPEPEPEPAPPPPGGMSSAPAVRFIRAVSDKTRATVGEQVTVTWYLYFLQGVDKYDPTTEPQTEGFWVEDITPMGARGNLARTTDTVAGRTYQVATLLKKALFPLKAGKQTITALEAEVSQVDFFGSALRRERLKSDPIVIEVVAAPKEAQPAGFEAPNVGTFSMTAQADRTAVAVGEAVTLTVTIKGKGNLRNLRPPALPALEGWKSYPPKNDVKLEAADDTIAGTRTLEYLLLPERPGTTMITSLILPHYDPQARAYAVAKTEPVRVEVTGDAAAHAGATPPGATGGTPASGTGADNVIAAEIRPIRAQAGLKRDLGATFYRSGAFTGILLVPPLGLALAVAVGRLRERFGGDTRRTRRRRTRALVRKRLSAAEHHRAAGRATAFYIEIDRVLRDLLAARLGQSVAGLRMDELSALLRARGMPDQMAARLIAELEDCDLARFAPGSAGVGNERMSASLERAAELIEAIEKTGLREESA